MRSNTNLDKVLHSKGALGGKTFMSSSYFTEMFRIGVWEAGSLCVGDQRNASVMFLLLRPVFLQIGAEPLNMISTVKPEAKLHHWICCMSSRGCFSLCKVNRSMKCVLFLSQTLPSSSNYWRWKVSIGCAFNITLSNFDPFKTSSWQVIIIVPIIISIISIVGAGDLGNEFQ